jgi:outer membrane lipoprotein-sorting protein
MQRPIAFFFAFLIQITFADTGLPAQPGTYDQKGEELVRQASQKILSYESFRIDFSYVMENEQMQISERMDGVLLARGNSYHMKVGDNAFVSDGVNVWTYLGDVNEVHISLVEDTEGGLTPTSLFHEFETQFRSRYIRQETHQGQLVDLIDMVPHQPTAFYKYRLALDARTQQLVYTAAYDRHGGTYTYAVKNFQENVRIPENTFGFSLDAHPGVEVIDLR